MRYATLYAVLRCEVELLLCRRFYIKTFFYIKRLKTLF